MATFRPGDQPRTRSIAPAQSAPQPTKIDTKEPAQGGEKSPAETPTYTPNVRGADISLLNTLNNIVFVEGTNGGMSNEVAYIRYWKRGGTTGRTEVRSDSQLLGPLGNVPPEVAQQAWNPTKINLLGVLGSTTQNIDWSVSENYWEKDPSFIKTTSGTVVSSTDITPPPSQIPAPPAETNPLSNLPSIPQNNYVNQFPARVTRPKPTKFERIIYGRSFSANPSGITLTAEPTARIEDAVWMFLFNPEELQLESGPDYNKAETWGVSDPANSGQPLSWRNNKNRKLTFSKVVLHGYTFGKRVEKLEEGLQKLFMARDGENGSDGPPVLEFVWGRRIFGPCVIQNIRVREQAWDKGILVNAEVSFELEQVPEWTINDGEVDVARPGRQPLINDPTLPGREQQEAAASAAEAGSGFVSGAGAGAGSQEPPKNKPGGGGGNPRATPDSRPLSKCQEAGRLKNEFYSKVERLVQGPLAGGNKGAISRALAAYSELYDYAVNTALGADFTRLIKSPTNPTELRRIVDIQIKEAERSLFPNYSEAYLSIRSAANSGRIASETLEKSQKCKDAFKAATAANREVAKKRECKGKELGAPCKNLKRGQPTVTCSGIRLICDGSTLQLPGNVR